MLYQAAVATVEILMKRHVIYTLFLHGFIFAIKLYTFTDIIRTPFWHFVCFICGHFTNILCKVLFTFYRDFINISHCPLLTRPILRALFTEKTLTFYSDFEQSNIYILQTFHVLYLKILCTSFGIHFTDISFTFFSLTFYRDNMEILCLRVYGDFFSCNFYRESKEILQTFVVFSLKSL